MNIPTTEGKQQKKGKWAGGKKKIIWVDTVHELLPSLIDRGQQDKYEWFLKIFDLKICEESKNSER